MNRPRGLPDFLIFFLTICIVSFGIIMVFSASNVLAFHETRYGNDPLYFVKRQIMWAGIGLFFMLVASNIPLHIYKRNFAKIAMFAMFLLTLVYVPGIGKELNNARGWIGFGSFTLQPLEFAKLGLVMYLAGIISKKGEGIRDFKHGLLPVLTVTAIFCFAIAVEPDVGGAAIVGLTAAVVIFSSNVQLKHLFVLGAPIVIVGTIYTFSASYRRARFSTLLDPWNDQLGAGYQVIQSFIAMAHGSISGVGFGKSIQKYLYLPYPQTDFIFPIIAEELGFVGCGVLILVFLILLWRILYITQKCTDDFGKLIGIGVVSMIGVQLFVNVGGVTGLIPITGVTLPFISYGGSSMLTLLMSVGVVLSVTRDIDRQRRTRMQKGGKPDLKVIR
jgi:cell division protein FtsW